MEKEGREKVIVTGGAGFIGSHLVDALVGRGFDVHVIDNLVAGKKEQVNPKATLHELDVTDLDAIRSVFSGATFVFHLAALPSVPYSIEHPIETQKTNVDGTLAVLVASTEAGVKRVIFSASSAAYGDQETLPLSENLPMQPKSPYALHKCAGELYCRTWSEVYGLPTVSLRYFNVYGARSRSEGAYASAVARFLAQRGRGEPLTIVGDGEQTRDFVHVADVVHANILAMESDKVGRGEVINIGTGEEVSVNEIAALIGGPTVSVPARLEPRRSVADNVRAKDLLGWSPQVSLEVGVTKLT